MNIIKIFPLVLLILIPGSGIALIPTQSQLRDSQGETIPLNTSSNSKWTYDRVNGRYVSVDDQASGVSQGAQRIVEGVGQGVANTVEEVSQGTAQIIDSLIP